MVTLFDLKLLFSPAYFSKYSRIYSERLNKVGILSFVIYLLSGKDLFFQSERNYLQVTGLMMSSGGRRASG